MGLPLCLTFSQIKPNREITLFSNGPHYYLARSPLKSKIRREKKRLVKADSFVEILCITFPLYGVKSTFSILTKITDF